MPTGYKPNRFGKFTPKKPADYPWRLSHVAGQPLDRSKWRDGDDPPPHAVHKGEVLVQPPRPQSAPPDRISLTIDPKTGLRPKTATVRTMTPGMTRVISSYSLGFALVARPAPSQSERRRYEASQRRTRSAKGERSWNPPPVGTPVGFVAEDPGKLAPRREPHSLFWVHRDDIRHVFTLGPDAPLDLQHIFRAAKLLLTPCTAPENTVTWKAVVVDNMDCGAQGLLSKYRELEDIILSKTTNPRAAQRAAALLHRTGSLPENLDGSAYAFTKVLCEWVWHMCYKMMTSEWNHRIRREWVATKASKELAWSKQYGDKKQMLADVKQCWKELRADRAAIDARA